MLGSTTAFIEQAVHISVSLLGLGNRGTPGREYCGRPGWQSPRGSTMNILNKKKCEYYTKKF